MKDPILEELRRIREEYAAKFGYDPRRMHEYALWRQYTWGHEVVSFAPPERKPKRRDAV